MGRVVNARLYTHGVKMAEPYTPEELAELQTVFDVRSAKTAGEVHEFEAWVPREVPMDPYRVQASVEAAGLRGLRAGLRHAAEEKEERRREKLVAIGIAFIAVIAIVSVTSVVGPYLFDLSPVSAPIMQSE